MPSPQTINQIAAIANAKRAGLFPSQMFVLAPVTGVLTPWDGVSDLVVVGADGTSVPLSASTLGALRVTLVPSTEDIGWPVDSVPTSPSWNVGGW